ncbi:MAG: tetratricopeptide repeat protein [Acidobacteria bacterium]|nr:tetratricopeptide repeat protein [Acidobacteriota bacterium]
MTPRARFPRGCLRRGILFLASLALLLTAAVAAADNVDPWVYAHAGLDHFYSLEYKEAISDLEKAVEGDPGNPILENFLTNAYLFEELHRLGQLEGNLYSASNAFLREKKPEPGRQPAELIRQRIARVKQLAERRLERNPRDVNALYALGLAHGIEANMLFTLEKKYLDALRTGSKANELHERLLRLDPNYHDARLIPGLYQYAVGSIPRSVKWLAFLFGYRGSKQRGIQLMQQAMMGGKWVTSDAAILLAVIYGREKQHAYARQLLTAVSGYYPRNPLLFLEIGRSYEREGNRKAALEIYLQAADRREAGAPGYFKLKRERLYYEIGSLYQHQGALEKALQAYGKVSEEPNSDGLLVAYSALRRGEIFLAQNRPERARAEYERAAALPYEEPRREAQHRLRTLKP